MRIIEVVAAVIEREGRVLATQRGYGSYKGWWEFPGGKVEPGEGLEQALAREIHEELDAALEVERPLITVEYDYPEFHLVMHCFLAHLPGGFTLLEHLGARWVGAGDIDGLKWLEADAEVIAALKAQGIVRA